MYPAQCHHRKTSPSIPSTLLVVVLVVVATHPVTHPPRNIWYLWMMLPVPCPVVIHHRQTQSHWIRPVMYQVMHHHHTRSHWIRPVMYRVMHHRNTQSHWIRPVMCQVILHLRTLSQWTLQALCQVIHHRNLLNGPPQQYNTDQKHVAFVVTIYAHYCQPNRGSLSMVKLSVVTVRPILPVPYHRIHPVPCHPMYRVVSHPIHPAPTHPILPVKVRDERKKYNSF